MKRTARMLSLAFAAICALALVGCTSLQFEAAEAHQTVSFPGFSDALHATGISKTERAGKVTYKAENLTHETAILGFSRAAVYKGATLKLKAKAQTEE